MTEPTTIDWFATRNEDSFRDEARNILDSYAHPWDVLAELTQNAVDAIELSRRTEHALAANRGAAHVSTIQITIDAQQRSVTVRDDGVGISASEIIGVLKPHFSCKRGKSLRGEKGVGLTYIALVGNKLTIRTKSADGSRQATVIGAQDWIGRSRQLPTIEITPLAVLPTSSTFTEVEVGEIPRASAGDDELDIFELNFKQLAFLLRTRTAIGSTRTLFSDAPDLDIQVRLAVKSAEGLLSAGPIDFSYFTPAELLPKKQLIELKDVIYLLGRAEGSKINGRSIYFSKNYLSKGGKDIKVYCFLTSRRVFREESEKLKLPEDLRIQGGVYVATKGMPTGILLPTPKTGRAGYWPNFYMVVEYDNVKLDLGRKSITGPRVVEMLSKQAGDVFNDVDRYIKYAVREEEGTLDAVLSQAELQDELIDIRGEPAVTFEDGRGGKDLPLQYPMLREPKLEQDVVAMFAMVLARGLLPYELLRVSSIYRYDAFIRFRHGNQTAVLVAEFKFAGESILKDLSEAKARYGQLQLLVCWSLDLDKLRQEGFIVDILDGSRHDLPGTTHRLAFPSSANVKDQPIAVIVLQNLLSRQS